MGSTATEKLDPKLVPLTTAFPWSSGNSVDRVSLKEKQKDRK